MLDTKSLGRVQPILRTDLYRRLALLVCGAFVWCCLVGELDVKVTYAWLMSTVGLVD